MKRAIVVCDLGFGDSSKGAWTDAFCRWHDSSLVVRYGGGPQCSHTVVLPDGRFHRFAQIGAGTFAGARTYLSKYTLIEPYALLNEAAALEKVGVPNALELLRIDGDCPVITPYHWIANRLRETARGKDRHGSTGFGVGELRADQEAGHEILTAENLWSKGSEFVLSRIRNRKIEELRHLEDVNPECHDLFYKLFEQRPSVIAESYHDFARFTNIIQPGNAAKLLATSDTVLYEGHQGVLLDEVHGFAPHNTYTNCTPDNAKALIAEAGGAETTVVGCLRAYATRHGAGPFPSEVVSHNALAPPEPHNRTDPWQGAFRVGHFDAVMARYAIRVVGGIDELAISHLDCFSGCSKPWGMVDHYLADGMVTTSIPSGWRSAHLAEMRKGPVLWTETPILDIERELKMPVTYTAHGPTHEHRRKIK